MEQTINTRDIVGKYFKERKSIETTNYYYVIEHSVWPNGDGYYYILTLEETINLLYGFTVTVKKKFYREKLIDALVSNMKLGILIDKTLNGEKARTPIKEITKEEFDKVFSENLEMAKNWETNG